MSQQDDNTGVTSTNSDDNNDRETRVLCLLSLDGGGVRGLSTLYLLRALMRRLNDERQDLNLAHVKPCDVFDLIAGTSTGG
jgi:patatin-like phospholipase/acyl hydrolase